MALIGIYLGLIAILRDFVVEKTAETPSSIEIENISISLKPIGEVPMNFRKVGNEAS